MSVHLFKINNLSDQTLNISPLHYIQLHFGQSVHSVITDILFDVETFGEFETGVELGSFQLMPGPKKSR